MKKKQVTIYLEQKTADDLEAISKKLGQTVSFTINELLRLILYRVGG